MTKTEMLAILRGKVLHESTEEIQERLNQIADELEASERVVHAHWIRDGEGSTKCSRCSYGWIDHCSEENAAAFVDEAEYCFSCGARMDEAVTDDA